MNDLPDPRRVIGNIIQLGSIESVDRGDATCRVRVGDTVSDDIPFIVQRAGHTTIWSPPTVGEQCVMLCPEGDPESAIVLLGLFSDAFPAPADRDIDLIAFRDGALLSYDAAAHELVAQLPAGGRVRIEAPGGVTIVGKVHVDGDMTITGTASADVDMVGGGKSLKSHVHTRVAAGGAVSGPPQ